MASSSSHGVLPHCGLNDSDLVECLSDSTGDRNNVILDTSCDSTANNEVEEFIEGFDDSFSNSAQLWVPNLPDTNLKPYPGQRFSDLEDACTFYTNYATTVGFNVRRETQRVRGSIVIHKYVVCSKSGTHDTSMSIISDNSSELSHVSASVGGPKKKKRKTVTKKCGCNAKIVIKNDGNGHFVIDRFIEVHNHPMVTEFGKQFLRANRSMNAVHRKFVVDAATTNLGSYRAHALFKSLTGSYSEVGATAKDFQNWMRDVKLFIGKRDVDMLIEKFKTKKETSDGGFFYEYETDSNGHLTRIFWADVQGRQSYDIFGDVISFDATYRTNKYGMVFVPFIGVDNHWKSITFAACLLNHEDITNFTWACEMFLKVFQRPPWCLITDQCPAMKVAIAETFPDSVVHRYCMWHIMQKFPAKIGAVFCAESEFMKKLNKFVWSSHISVAEFEEGWSSVLKEFELIARFCTLKLGSTIQDSEGYKTRDTSKKVWNEFQGCLGDVSYNKDGLEFLLEELKFLRIRVKQKVKNPCATKDDILQEIYGVRPSTSIIVHPPLQSNNKGCRKRIIGHAERSCDGKDRPKRVCKHCNVKAFHDSRNCPMKGEQLQVNPLANGLNVNVQGSAPPTLNVENLVNVNVQGFVPPNLNVEKSV
ncbi:hypothetical protein POM88_010417 [Heracleum sosnowskyi]|uniref:Protein FAR1-RELATED SEQUENCE n=1 Tax=Heracleum sosnowskyi TaxID=360622 RepID=A0AAD8IV26_9APIA|nr:hypothetical protein POM88_010417 [Heracleum sosnowskyi]